MAPSSSSSSIQPASSPHSRPATSRGIKRPRRSTAQAQAQANAGQTNDPGPSAAASSSSSTTAAGPRDIIRNKSAAQHLQQEDTIGMAYSSTPPTKPTKKHSSGSIITDDTQDTTESRQVFSKTKPSPRKTTPAVPVKSALAASARLAAGPPGSANGSISEGIGDIRYKRRMYIAFVDTAFADRERGSSKSYWDLVSQFRSSALTSNGTTGVQSLSLWLFALSHHVSKLDSSSHSQLVDNILELPWAGAGDDFSRSWCRFVCALVSARVEWANSVLERIVKAFRWKSNWLPLQPFNTTSNTASNSSPTTASPAPRQEQPTRRLLYTRCHLLLRALLTLVPTLPSSLNPLLIKHFPHKREGKREQSTYARNILFITQYESQVAETVWRVVLDRAIGLDVEIQIELDDVEDEEDDDDDENESDDESGIDPFDLVIDDEEEDDDDEDDEDDDGIGGGGGLDDISDDEADRSDEEGSNAGAAESEAQIAQREHKVREMVGKLDSILKVCFDHLDRIGKGKGRQQNELVLDSRSTWLSEFLGTAAGGGGSRSRASSSSASTPTLERSQSSSTLRADAESEELGAALPPPSGISRTRTTSPSRSSPESDEALRSTKDALFRQLLNLFGRSILPTFKCRHVQFLLFWFCSLDNDFADYFLGFLIHKAIYAGSANEDGLEGSTGDQRGGGSVGGESKSDAPAGRARGEPIVLRQAAASYVASFVSRAKYVSPPYTRTVVFNLCSYLEAHLEAYSNAVAFVNSTSGLNGVDEKTQRLALAPPGSEEHAIFYAVAQAVFYIFCFRWQDLQQNARSGGGGGALSGSDVLNGSSLRRNDKARDSAGIDPEDHDHDGGFMIGSLSSTGSSSYALPSSFHRVAPVEEGDADIVAPSARSNNPAINVEFPPDEDGAAPTAAATTANADWSPGLSVLQRAILSSLNPLQYCSPTVVRQFATVAQHVGFLYCWSVIEANRRGGGGSSVSAPTQQRDRGSSSKNSRPAKSVPGHGAALAKDLEGFFPFDPYRLNSTSDQFIKPMYREWHEVAPAGMMHDDDDDDGSSSSSSSGESDSESDASSDYDDADDLSISDTNDTSRDASRDVRTAGLEIPGAGKGGRRRHHRPLRDDAALLSPSDASSASTEHGQNDAFAKSLEAMSMSAG